MGFSFDVISFPWRLSFVSNRLSFLRQRFKEWGCIRFSKSPAVFVPEILSVQEIDIIGINEEPLQALLRNFSIDDVFPAALIQGRTHQRLTHGSLLTMRFFLSLSISRCRGSKRIFE
jgi:hypothetical protein